ncbi:unnamed protein product, partial [Rotaria sp. Silwood2]
SIYSSNLGPRVEDTAYAFLRDFNPDDIRCVNLFSRSVDLWETIPVRFSYTITRNPPNRHDSEPITTVVTSENIVEITLDDQQIRTALIEILNETFDSRTTTQFTINKLLPRFLHVKPKAKPRHIDPFKTIFPYEYFGNITMSLNRATSVANSTDVWWSVFENRTEFQVSPSCELKTNG